MSYGSRMDRGLNHTKTTLRSRSQFFQKKEVAGFHTNLTDGPSSGEDLLALLPTTLVDVIFLDFSMPGLHVVELVLALQQAHPTLPVMMLSVHDQPDLAADMMALGVCRFLTKSCHPETLLSVVREMARGELFLEPRLARHGLADLEAVPANQAVCRSASARCCTCCVKATASSRLARNCKSVARPSAHTSGGCRKSSNLPAWPS